jgi:predicted dehydrogenase
MGLRLRRGHQAHCESDPAVPFDWRFDRRLGGTTIADLGAHLFDLGRWIVGEVEDVVAQSETFVRERASRSGDGVVPVSVDDASAALVRFRGGARGTFEMARSCVRRPCDLTVEVNGADGTLVFDHGRLNELTSSGMAPAPTTRACTGSDASGRSIPRIPTPRTGGRWARG